MVDLLHAVILGVVEGLTEFIPVSSTGHLIIVAHLLGFEGNRASTFEVFIQLGAILAVVFLYKQRFLSLLSSKSNGLTGVRGLTLLALTTFPALIAGSAAHGFIKKNLFNSWTVAVGLGIGGIAIILVERFLPRTKKSGLDSLGWKDALYVGLFQCLALWPGISRSASTILGGMSIGIDRKTSAEYSFLAAVPVMFAAVSYDLYKNIEDLHLSDIPVFGAGFIVSFVSALFAVRFFIRLVGTRTLTPFGWYRIAVACVILFVSRQ